MIPTDESMKTETPHDARRRDERGFTLLEMAVIVLIIGVIAAIAAPQLFEARARSADRAAQANLKTAATVADTTLLELDNDYGKLDENTLKAEEKNIDFIPGPSASPQVVSFTTSEANRNWIGAARSKSGRCMYVRVSDDQGIRQAAGAKEDSCPASGAPAPGSADWKRTGEK